MSLTVAIILVVVLALLLVAVLGFLMTRPSELEEHRTGWRRMMRWRRRAAALPATAAGDMQGDPAPRPRDGRSGTGG